MKKRVLLFLLVFIFTVSAVSLADSESKIDLKSEILDYAKVVSHEKANEYVVPEFNEVTGLHVNARKVPILMFHEVGRENNGDYDDANFIRKQDLEAIMLYLSSNGYKTITMSELYDNWTNGTPLPEKSVVLTFDDGYASHFTFVKDIMSRFNAKATFYIVQDRLFMGIEGRNIEGVKVLKDAGMEIGVHTYSHPDFIGMTYDEIYKEVKTCKDFLEDELGITLETFSFPFGNYNDESIKVLKDLGLKTAVTTREGKADPNQFSEDGILKMCRHNIEADITMERLEQLLDLNY